ncbi:MAG: hypothetical protein QOI53_1194 [Verrucomicrobiota bacterium]|jgi:hypothetical protein|nr:hypothetical protein [Verrucomicrobiota bacterium]
MGDDASTKEASHLDLLSPQKSARSGYRSPSLAVAGLKRLAYLGPSALGTDRAARPQPLSALFGVGRIPSQAALI